MNIFADIYTKLTAALAMLAPDANTDKVTLEPPRDATHGDMATNAAMVLAKSLGMNPRQFAEKLKPLLEGIPEIAGVEIAGPGFINLRLHANIWLQLLETILENDDYGQITLGKNEAINVEYVSANPTGPMHVGHARGAVFGDALANLLAFAGFKVTREYYINDAGAQVDVLAASSYLRYKEALGEKITIPEGLYPGDYLKPVGAMLAAKYGAILEPHDPRVKNETIDAMMDMIRDDLAKLNVKHDLFTSERALHAPLDHVKIMLDQLTNDGHIYQGVLEKPKGTDDAEWEPREQTLFRATNFGDDVDRPLLKSDGSYTYFASDIAYHKNKFDRGFKQQIDVWGADHGGYIKRVEAALKAVTNGQATLDVKICQLVKLLRNGEIVKMSKRSGDFVTLAEMVEEVGKDAVRFMMLFRKNDAPLDFDMAKVLETNKENPVFYVHYAYARINSTLIKGKYEKGGNVSLLTDAGEIGLIKKLAEYPRMIEQAANAHEPHRVAFYVHELATMLHSHYSRGNEEISLRFIRDNDLSITQARLSLIVAVNKVLKSGLNILGVDALEELR
jgi:arginyl-tRNA synthetase